MVILDNEQNTGVSPETDLESAKRRIFWHKRLFLIYY